MKRNVEGCTVLLKVHIVGSTGLAHSLSAATLPTFRGTQCPEHHFHVLLVLGGVGGVDGEAVVGVGAVEEAVGGVVAVVVTMSRTMSGVNNLTTISSLSKTTMTI